MRKFRSSQSFVTVLSDRNSVVKAIYGNQYYRYVHVGNVVNSKNSAEQQQQQKDQVKEKVEPTPLNMWKQTREGVDKITGAFYNNVPNQVKEVLEGGGRPGSYKRKLSLSFMNFWQEYQLVIGALILTGIGYYTYSTFSETELSERLSPYVVLCLGFGIIVLVGIGRRRYYQVDADSVYRIAMQRLQKHSGISEVLGSPILGSESRALVLTGGDIRMKGIYPIRRSKRVQMIFPLRGPQRRGIVSIEAKKLKGYYHINLLTLDVPSPGGGEERIYLTGNKEVYERGHIMNELRVPFIQALSLRNEYDMEDDSDDLEKPSLSQKFMQQGRGVIGGVQQRMQKLYQWGDKNLWQKRQKLQQQKAP